ncbi:hypothetical protein QFC21_003223 [Naganishia friedmannii]|uniref:Uncharacterized protein n=1 Tax=Naganishia friedmannii TaxID=89922 RepID=A0ACC2VRZ5_9TREE|nr:hypothetical protein QFC21_003223 [Naganishia friedmannii]
MSLPFEAFRSTFASVQPPSSASAPTPSLLSTLLASGAELGHSTSRLAPSFMPYIYGHRAGLHIIDLESSTVPLLKKAASLVKEVVKADGVVLIVGTRAEHRSIVRKAVERLEGNGFGVAGTTWQAGTLTNSVSYFGPRPIQQKSNIPDLVVILNPSENLGLIRECTTMKVPTVGIVDTHTDPRSVRTSELVLSTLSIAGAEGREERLLDAKPPLDKIGWLNVQSAIARQVGQEDYVMHQADDDYLPVFYQLALNSSADSSETTENPIARFTAATRTAHYTRPPIAAGNPSGYPPRNADFTGGVKMAMVVQPSALAAESSSEPAKSSPQPTESAPAVPESTGGWKASPGGGGKKAGLGWNEQSGTQWKQFLDVPDNQFGWTYNWASSRNSDGKYPVGLNYVPMLHGDRDGHPAEWETNKPKFKQEWGVTHVMSFNEPDKPKSDGGSEMPLADAVALHKKYFTAELQKQYTIVGPAYSGLEGFISWDEECKVQGGCNYDVVPLHFYGDDAGALEAILKNAAELFPKKPLWVTEIGCIKYGATTEFCSDEKVIAFMKEALPILQARTERYSWQGSFASFDGAPGNRNNMMEPGDNKINKKGTTYATTT